MQTHTFTRSSGDAQAARAAGPTEILTLIVGQHEGELDEPRNFIRKAARMIKTGKAMGRSHTVTARKAIYLMTAASYRATRIGCWSTAPGYDPVPDLVTLYQLAAVRLGPGREPTHPVTQFRSEVANTIRALGGVAS